MSKKGDGGTDGFAEAELPILMVKITEIVTDNSVFCYRSQVSQPFLIPGFDKADYCGRFGLHDEIAQWPLLCHSSGVLWRVVISYGSLKVTQVWNDIEYHSVHLMFLAKKQLREQNRFA